MQTRTHAILLGMSALGAIGFLNASTPAQASPPITVTQIQYRVPPGKSYQVITGRVTRNYRGNGFLLITDRGSTYRVWVRGGEPRRLSVGDRVRVSGYYSGGAFRAQTFTMIRDR